MVGPQIPVGQQRGGSKISMFTMQFLPRAPSTLDGRLRRKVGDGDHAAVPVPQGEAAGETRLVGLRFRRAGQSPSHQPEQSARKASAWASGAME